MFLTLRICISAAVRIPDTHELFSQLGSTWRMVTTSRSCWRSRRIFFHAIRVTAVTRTWYTNEGVQRSANHFFWSLVQLNLIPRAITFNLPNGRHGEFQRGKIGNRELLKYFWRIMYHLPLAKILHPKTTHLVSNWHLSRKIQIFPQQELYSNMMHVSNLIESSINLFCRIGTKKPVVNQSFGLLVHEGRHVF